MPILIERLAGVKATGYYGAMSLLFAFGCQLTVGRVCDVVGHRAPALVANVIVTLLAFGVAFFHDSLIALEVYGILGAGAAWGLSTTIPRFINEFTEPHEKGHGVGLTHLAWSTGVSFRLRRKWFSDKYLCSCSVYRGRNFLNFFNGYCL